ncbi:MAG: helix-turn-helix domain-containing protein [Frankia sp.]
MTVTVAIGTAAGIRRRSPREGTRVGTQERGVALARNGSGGPLDASSLDVSSLDPEDEPALGHGANGGPGTAAESSRDFVQSFARGLSVIRAFPADGAGLTLSDVARSTGLPRAAARRFLLTLETLGYVRCTGRIFALSPQVLELSHGYLAGNGRADLLEAINTSIPNAQINETDLRQRLIPRLMAPARADAGDPVD